MKRAAEPEGEPMLIGEGRRGGALPEEGDEPSAGFANVVIQLVMCDQVIPLKFQERIDLRGNRRRSSLPQEGHAEPEKAAATDPWKVSRRSSRCFPLVETGTPKPLHKSSSRHDFSAAYRPVAGPAIWRHRQEVP